MPNVSQNHHRVSVLHITIITSLQIILQMKFNKFKLNLAQMTLINTSRKRKIRPKFNLAEYRSNGDQICAIIKSIFLAQLGCQSSHIQIDYLTSIRL